MTMLVCAALAVLAAALFWLVAKESPHALTPQAGRRQKDSGRCWPIATSAWSFVLSFLGLRLFNGLTTWLEQILAPTASTRSLLASSVAL